MATIDLKILLGMAIKKQRTSLGISQEELAYRAALHRTYVSDLERGVRNPSMDSVEKLARALQLSVSTLFEQASKDNEAEQTVEILLVQDNPRDVELTKQSFTQAGITNPVHVVHDGAEGLDFLFGTGAYATRRGDPHPRVVLLDLNLPRVGPLEVLRRLKADERTRDIPVIILTASTRERDIGECRRLGAANYIVKPVGFHNFSEVTVRLNLGWRLIKPNTVMPAAL
ncbi:MAG TPA: response regulator [Chthoniobacterales bacterium]|nr:response regulator [Chthoniobacterales bacterium]